MTEFSANLINCNIHYKYGFFDYEVENIQNIQHQIIHFKNSDHYIKIFIDNIKHNVIKKYPNLSSICVYLNVFDKNNVLHRLIITVSNMIHDILKLKKMFYCTNKTVFVSVSYENKIVFIGSINFTGLK